MVVPNAIVLCGGLGTRLRPMISEMPKPLAPVKGRPFLSYVLCNLYKNGIRRTVLAVGYKGNLIEKHFGDSFYDMFLHYSPDGTELLGTGGAVLKAMSRVKTKDVLVVNGDSFCSFNLESLFKEHSNTITVLVAPSEVCSVATCSCLGDVVPTGIFLINVEYYKRAVSSIKGTFSLESVYSKNAQIKLVETNEKVIDIGTPELYNLSQNWKFNLRK